MSQPITAALIKELRDMTGVGMAKCKEALEKSGGDIQIAVDNLRKAGIAGAVKKEGRATNEGMIASHATDSQVAVVEIKAETDFVVRNERFQQFAAEVAKLIATLKPANLEELAQFSYPNENLTVDQYRSTLMQTLGENIQVCRFQIFPKGGDNSIGVYSHLGGKIVCVVAIDGSGSEEQLCKDIAMHIAASSPEYLSPETVPQDIIDRERDVAQGQVAGKPAQIIDKIIAGKLDAFYDTNCLLRQKYLRDDQITIAELVEKRAKETNKPLKVVNFIRWNVGQ